jgi:signal transduction histidine kinase
MPDAAAATREAEIERLITALQRHIADGKITDVVRYLTDELEKRALMEQRCAELFESEQLARAEAREQQEASRNKDYFLGVLSHEMRTPLQPVLAACSVLLRDGRLPADMIEEVRTIQRNVQLEARLIDDLLDLTRIRRGKLSLEKIAVNMHSIIARSVDICEHDAISKHLTFSVALNATRTWVHADPGRLQQVMWNLIKNAVKFTPAGGQVTVQTSDMEDGRMLVQVIDTGIGIDADLMPRIFDAFEQGETAMSRKFGGLGLGLSISKVLVERHDGTLDAASDGKDRGATFSLTLPTIEPPRGSAPGETVTRGLPPRLLKILLVEDDRDSARVLARLLRSLKHEVIVAGDCASAMARGAVGEFDLLIADLGLPDGSGLDLLVRLRHAAPIKAIALTGYGSEDDIRRSFAAGFEAHLTKPITLDQLVQAMIRLFP